ncbi:hypothetical protein [Xylanibacter ruminicola]|uniref:Bacteriocin-type signal sequence-containing protein n=1 Tax=Xylanibacter ruminicola TaxID=839 RepID=A0A1M6WUX9_XYLRU|nr:hypothetical protein [Xylanibacter ruminicola]SHK97389.1 hypothetical protein SAMN05216463_1185 [Xylanibacter ruminicola]
MATLTAEQIKQKKQQLKKLDAEAKKLRDELVEAGAWPLSDGELDNVSGGAGGVFFSLFMDWPDDFSGAGG